MRSERSEGIEKIEKIEEIARIESGRNETERADETC
jgi:hypothetical protein